MTIIEILTKVSSMQIENIMRHEQMANVMDFMGLHGFKRQAEYHYFKESAAFRSTHRYAINHCSKMIYEKDIPNPRIQPASWEGHTRQEVDDSTRRKYARQMFVDWRDWEKQAKQKLHSLYEEASKMDLPTSEKLLAYVLDVEEELKYLERQLLEYDAVGWNMAYIMQKQDELHEKYQELEKKIGFDIN